MTDLVSLAAAGEVGGDFFKERSSDTLPCQANPNEVFCFDWARENIDRYGTPTVQHLELVAISVLIGFAIAFALALLAHRVGWLRAPLLAVTGILYTIPSLAFFFLLLPVSGIGRDTAIIALAVYTLQIIYRNTMLGLNNVPSAVKEAARGMGYTDRQILWRIELPLASRSIVAGAKTSAVIAVGTATIAAFIGAGGYGERIVAGLAVNDSRMLLAGALPAAALALAVQWVFDASERWVVPAGLRLSTDRAGV